MHTSHRNIAWLLILLWIVPGLVFAEERARLEGRVIDPQGKPIQGVKVTATCKQDPKFHEVRTTDKKGTFTIIFTQIEVTYQYRFEKEGFQTLDANQDWTAEGTQRFDWTMQPGSGQAQAEQPAAAAPASSSPEAVNVYNAGVMAVRSKDYRTAEAKFKEAVGDHPKLVQAWIALSSAQFQEKDFKGSAEAAEKAVALGSKDPALLTTSTRLTRTWGMKTRPPTRSRTSRPSGARPKKPRSCTTRESPSRRRATTWAPSPSSRRPWRSIRR